ncbi:50S ribosomal protein L27 [Buchnera aphidicola (Chaitophorus sp. 3695)]|uniref:50S ribosomal protein L27 n=1 Tax=Buchnera aphidicola TaxID=9 RepID=UPI0034640367
MAQKKAGGSSRNGRDSHSKRLGIKRFGGEFVNAGSIIIKQRGTKFHSGLNTKCGRDHTIYAVKSGIVEFKKNGLYKKKIINIIEKNKIL